MTKEKIEIAIFGSAFNPPTLGHLSILKRLTLFDKVLVVPSIAHAWGKEMLPFSIRCQLVDAFICDLKQNNAQAYFGEKELQNKLATEQHKTLEQINVTTYDLLSFLQQKYPQANLTFVVGPDNLFNFSKFYKADEIIKQWQILMCPQTLDIRSTLIRETLLKHGQINDLVSPQVATLIQQLHLYVN